MTDSKSKRAIRLKALKAAFPKTLPILAGFLFLGISYGFYMRVSGFSFFFPLCMSIIIFGGSLEFVAVTMLLSPFAPIQTFLMALVIQARHLFYGIAMLDKYKGTGKKKLYLIFGMCDESFSINCSQEIPEGVDKGYFYFFVTLLNHLYWITGATLGSLIGGIYRIIRFLETKNVVTLVVGILVLVTGIGNLIAWVVDLVTEILSNKICVLAD